MFDRHDTSILRRLAGRLRDLAAQPVMAERARRWTELNDLRCPSPLLLVSPEGAWKEIDAILPAECRDATARGFENRLRRALYQAEEIGDDAILEVGFDLPWRLDVTGFGVDLKRAESGIAGGAYKAIPPLANLDRDLDLLRPRQITVRRAESEAEFELAHRAFGDLLTVRRRGSYFWSVGLTATAIQMIGLEQLMLNMFDDPAGLHRLMRWLSDEMAGYLRQFEELQLLSYNNANVNIGSGGRGLVSALPSDRAPAAGPVRLKQLWGFGESQETVGVSPEMFAEFVWPYQKPLLEQFGLTYYGCCEPIELRFRYLRELSNLRCLSVSPWSKPEACAELYRTDYVLCRKPNPSLVCVGFDADAIRADLRHALDVCAGLNLAIVLKDTHTVENEPDRFARWVRIAREEIARRA